MTRGEALNGLKRSLMCGEPREANIGQKVTLMGWVQRFFAYQVF